jgi:phosphonate transport system substrate-binding protein
MWRIILNLVYKYILITAQRGSDILSQSFPITRNKLASLRATALLVLGLAIGSVRAEVSELVLGIAPLLSESETRAQFQPLCDYLAAVSRLPCRIGTRPNFITYWETIRQGKEFNLVLDEAHFTDYRATKMKFTVLAKIPGTVTYSLILPRAAKLNDPAQLAGRRIATLGIPSMGAAQLNGLFTKPSKQPILVEVDDAALGFALLRDGKVEAAILPTPLVRGEIMLGAPFRALLSTAPLPHMGFSSAPTIDPELRQRLRQALIEAHKSDTGRDMLARIGLQRFDPANSTVYAGQGRILKDYWGY